jgi:hypothetical protein
MLYQKVEIELPVQMVGGHVRYLEAMGGVGHASVIVMLIEKPNYMVAKIGSGDENWVAQFGMDLTLQQAKVFFPTAHMQSYREPKS